MITIEVAANNFIYDLIIINIDTEDSYVIESINNLFLCDNFNEDNLVNLFSNIVVNQLIPYLNPLSKIFIISNDHNNIENLKMLSKKRNTLSNYIININNK